MLIFIKDIFSKMYQSKINDRKINRESSSMSALNLLRLKIKEIMNRRIFLGYKIPRKIIDTIIMARTI